MSALWPSVLAYSAQLAALVAAACFAAWVCRIRAPRIAMIFWNGVLVGTVALPLLFASRRDELTASVALGQIVAASSGGSPLADRAWETFAAPLMLLLLGVTALRLGRLTLGLARLSGIRRRARLASPELDFIGDLPDRLQVDASIRLSDDVDCPATLGVRRPLILLPSRALALPHDVLRAIVCHELLHVRRRDWARTVAEQFWLALLWFHPAAHLLLSRVGLTREALVDEETISITRDRRAYAHALLAFAETATQPPLAVLPLIAPRHLPRRIALIAQEVRMSRRQSIIALTLALLIVTAATGATARRLPISLPLAAVTTSNHVARGQEPVRPGNGVSLPRAIKEVRPQYTPEAIQARIQGTLYLETVIQPSGEPTDIRVTKSLDQEYGLDRQAVDALSQWRFEPGRKDGKAVPVIVQIEMRFTLK